MSLCAGRLYRREYRIRSIHPSGVHAVDFVQEFPPTPDKKLWLEWYRTRLRLNLAMCRKSTGRPIFTKFCNKMDECEHQEKWCGLCRQTGHTR
ncbi:hypothetical protein Ahy_A10g050329 [Arachis hypogaea]|uniref:Uncharacterized protein n=1 Tax=Arachis hypogaea TaxID=3818 RepID=A0A445B946_ARAHY|nr:hypothetical protein Ahy_A10g050329 [Arachis hypogaea]